MQEYTYTFIGFISNIKALDMSIQLKINLLELPGMIYNRHRPALFEHIATKRLFGLYQQEENTLRATEEDGLWPQQP